MTEEQQEEHVYSLLFEECDKEKTGLVNINKLVEYIRVMRSQVQEGEDPNEVSCYAPLWFFKGLLILL